MFLFFLILAVIDHQSMEYHRRPERDNEETFGHFTDVSKHGHYSVESVDSSAEEQFEVTKRTTTTTVRPSQNIRNPQTTTQRPPLTVFSTARTTMSTTFRPTQAPIEVTTAHDVDGENAAPLLYIDSNGIFQLRPIANTKPQQTFDNTVDDRVNQVLPLSLKQSDKLTTTGHGKDFNYEKKRLPVNEKVQHGQRNTVEPIMYHGLPIIP